MSSNIIEHDSNNKPNWYGLTERDKQYRETKLQELQTKLNNHHIKKNENENIAISFFNRTKERQLGSTKGCANFIFGALKLANRLTPAVDNPLSQTIGINKTVFEVKHNIQNVMNNSKKNLVEPLAEYVKEYPSEAVGYLTFTILKSMAISNVAGNSVGDINIDTPFDITGSSADICNMASDVSLALSPAVAPAISISADVVSTVTGMTDATASIMMFNNVQSNTTDRSDPSDGLSEKTGVKQPVDKPIDKSNITKVEGEQYTPQKGGVTYEQYVIDDNGVKITCWGRYKKGKFEMHRIIKVENGKLVVKYPNNGKYSLGEFENCSHDALCEEFAKASTGFCKRETGCSGIKALKGQAYIQGKPTNFEIKVMGEFGDARFFGSKPTFDPVSGKYTLNLHTFGTHHTINPSYGYIFK